MLNSPGCIFWDFPYRNPRMNIRASHGLEIERPNWAPLKERIGERCADFMWMYAKDGVEYYKHIVTRRYLCLNSSGGVFLCIDGVLEPVEFDYGYAVATSG
jgi:hypothetical protein